MRPEQHLPLGFRGRAIAVPDDRYLLTESIAVEYRLERIQEQCPSIGSAIAPLTAFPQLDAEDLYILRPIWLFELWLLPELALLAPLRVALAKVWGEAL